MLCSSEASTPLPPRESLVIRTTLSCAVALLVTTPWLFAQPSLPQRREELRRLEVEVDKLRRRFPSSLTVAEQGEFIASLAKSADLQLEVQSTGDPRQVTFPDGTISPLEVVTVEIHGRDEYVDLSTFLTRLGSTPRVADIASLNVVAAGNGVQYEGRVELYSYRERPESRQSGGDPVAAVRAAIEREQDLILLMTEHLVRQDSLRLAKTLAILGKTLHEYPISLTRLKFEDDLRLEGILTGASSRAALERALGLTPMTASLDIAATGMCRKFTIIGRLSARVDTDGVEIDSGLFDSFAEAACESKRAESLAPLKVKGRATNGITVKLRDVDLVDLFFVLQDAVAENFVINPDVRGRISVDIENATVDQVFSALRSRGLRIGDPPLRRVSATADATPAIEQQSAGEVLSLQLKSADLRDVLCYFSQIAGLEIYSPDVAHTVSIFATTEWDRSLVALLATASFGYRIDENRMVIGRNPETLNVAAMKKACELTFSPPSRLAQARIEGFDTSDLQFAGVARTKRGWTAYAYRPSRHLSRIEAGQVLNDGEIESVTATAAVVATKNGKITVRVVD